MSNPVQRGPGNDAFGGGALIRAAPPTSGPTGALPGPNTSTPLGGVNPPSTPFFARPNSGTNIRIPYNRVVPLSDPRGGGLKAVVKPDAGAASSPEEWYTHMHADTQSKTLMSETDTLHATRIAFVLAKKSNVGITSQTADEDALRDFSYAINSTIAPVLPGTQKLQKLCSLEYLQRYIDTVANRAGFNSVIDLGARPADANADDPVNPVNGIPALSNNKVQEWSKKAGLLADVYREASRRHGARQGVTGFAPFTTDEGSQDKFTHKMRKSDESVVSTFATATNAATSVNTFLAAVGKQNDDFKGAVGFSGLPPSDASLLDIGDLGRLNSAVGKGVNYNPSLSLGTKVLTQAAGTTFDDDAKIGDLNEKIAKQIAKDSGQPKVYHTLRQGIFTMDEGPFLRGYGMDAARTIVKAGFVGALQKLGGSDYSEGRCRGDDVAFAVLEDRLTGLGLFDWTPDGIMLSKFDNMPLDKLEDQRIDARDGALYNVCIQGPALTTTWTGDPSMEVLPMDKVFVVVVADLVIGKLQLSEKLPVGPAISAATPSAAVQKTAHDSFKNAIDNLTTFQLIPAYDFAAIGTTGSATAPAKDADLLRNLRGDRVVSDVGNWFPYDDGSGGFTAWANAAALPGAAQADDVRAQMLAALQVIGPRIEEYLKSNDTALVVAPDVVTLVNSVQAADTAGKLKTARDDLRQLVYDAQEEVYADATTVGVPAAVLTAAASFTAALQSLQVKYVDTYVAATITTLTTSTRDKVKAYYAAPAEYYGAFGKADADKTLDALLEAVNTINAMLPGSADKVQIFLTDSTPSANVPKVADVQLQKALQVFNAYLTGVKVGGTPKLPSRQEFIDARAKIMEATQLVKKPGNATGLGLGKTFAVGANAYEDWKQEAQIEYKGANAKLTRRLCNFRVQLATSSQIINSSELKFDVNGEQMPGSRMGLKLGTRISEYIVGGWCIGTVTDAAASRASMPSGMPMGPRSAPNTAAINLHVNIEWWNGDKMHRSYCNYKGNEKGLIRARFERPEQDGSNKDILTPVSTSVNLPMAPVPKAV